MKRLIVLTILLTTAISTTGCRRGLRLWGLRGARCGAPAPSFTPAPAYPPAYAPPICPPAGPACDACPVVPYGAEYGSGYGGGYGGSYGGVIDGGVVNGGVINGGMIDGGGMGGSIMQGPGAAYQVPSIDVAPPSGLDGSSLNRSTFNLPGGHPGIDLTSPVIPNRPVFSHVMGDRKLQPGDTIKGEYELPVESASAKTPQKK